jgi:hypothetical protein
MRALLVTTATAVAGPGATPPHGAKRLTIAYTHVSMFPFHVDNHLELVW